MAFRARKVYRTFEKDPWTSCFADCDSWIMNKFKIFKFLKSINWFCISTETYSRIRVMKIIVQFKVTANKRRERWNFRVKKHGSRRLIGRTMISNRMYGETTSFSAPKLASCVQFQFNPERFVDAVLVDNFMAEHNTKRCKTFAHKEIWV